MMIVRKRIVMNGNGQKRERERGEKREREEERGIHSLIDFIV